MLPVRSDHGVPRDHVSFGHFVKQLESRIELASAREGRNLDVISIDILVGMATGRLDKKMRSGIDGSGAFWDNKLN